MDESKIDIRELHWLMDMVHNIDVGLVVIDADYRVSIWNSFMQNHSGVAAGEAQGKSLFALFPEIEEEWFRGKVERARLLKSRIYTTWEQRPYLFRFRGYRPFTGSQDHMYQNVTLNPLLSSSGEVDYLCIILYDVTEMAIGKLSLEAANQELAKLSRTDRLTGLNNRGYWEECLAAEFQRYRRYGGASSLVMFDIDHFKRVNDTFGHQAGDEVLRVVSGLLRESARSTDISGRYGGEEFGVILTATELEGAVKFSERLRTNAEQLEVAVGEERIRFTISLGIAELNPGFETYLQWLECADKALYASKEGGRNRYSVYRDSGES